MATQPKIRPGLTPAKDRQLELLLRRASERLHGFSLASGAPHLAKARSEAKGNDEWEAPPSAPAPSRDLRRN
jgi:hypothetical protein